MKEQQKRGKLIVFSSFAAILFLATSLEAAYAIFSDNEQYALPDFLLRLSEYLSRGNASELARIRKEMVQQENIKQDRIKSTSGAVLNCPPSGNPLTDEFEVRYIEQVLSHTENTSLPYDPYTVIGNITDWDFISGDGLDGNCAHLMATGWYYWEGEYVGGEAIAVGALNGYAWDLSDIDVYAKKGPLTGSGGDWYNYLIVMVAYNPDDWNDFHYIGYEQVFSEEVEGYYFGSTWYTFNQMAFFTWCPYNWNPPQKSSVCVDFAEVMTGWY